MIPLFVAALLAFSGDRIDVKIDDASGALVSLVDRRDGARLLERSCDRYALQRSPKDETVASEADDRVVERRADALICDNPKLPGLRIEKTWRVEGRQLIKRVAFATDKKDLGLLKYSTASTAAPDFYRDGYLNDPSRHPIDYPYVFVKDLKVERQMLDCAHAADHHYAIFTNPKRQRGLAQYRFKVDDRFVHPLSGYSYEPGLYYGPTGWRIAVAAQWLTQGRRLSAEVRWHLFDGDHVVFHREYAALPEFAAEWDFSSPAWLKDVRATEAWVYGESSPDLSVLKAKVDAMGDGRLMVLLGGVFCNTRDYLADPLATPSGIPLPAKNLRELVDRLHALSPRIKVGPVTWQWGFGPLDPVFRKHPEWTVHDSDGQAVFAATGWSDEKVFQQLLTPADKDFVLSQYRGMAKRYDFDFIYMDSGQGGVTSFDWRTRQCAQDYDWADLYRGIRDAARSNRNGAAFFNGTPRLYSSYCDCGYFEGLGFVKVRDWRALADRVLLVKLYQPGDKWTTPLYWTSDNAQSYANTCLALGLKPGNFTSPNHARWWPLAAAAHEVESLRLAPEADPRPCWWKDQTDLEVYALRFPDGAFLNCISHAKSAEQARVACDLAPLGFDPARPIHVWQFRPRSVDLLDKTVVVTEAEANAIFAKEGNAPHRGIETRFVRSLKDGEGRFEETLSIEPGELQMLMLTQAAELACAVEGRPTQFLLPAAAGAKVQAVPADRALASDVVARREGYVLPDRKRSAVLTAASSSPQTVRRVEKAQRQTVQGVALLRSISLSCEHNQQNSAAADAGALSLRVSMGMEKIAGFASAEFEAKNLGALQLTVKLQPPYYGRYAAEHNNGCFAGFVADYHTPRGYTRRVLFPVAPTGSAVLGSSRPWWGRFGQKEAEATYLVPLQPSETMRLDLGLYAPADWDGQALWGIHLDNCGLGAALEVRVTGNGPAGARLARMPSPPPPPKSAQAVASFQGIDVIRFEDGAKNGPQGIVFPAKGLIEAAGLGVVTWKVERTAASKNAELWINYQTASGKYQLQKLPLQAKVAPGGQVKFDVDFRQYAPQDWTGRCRCRLQGDGVTAEIIANTGFQIF